MLKSFPYQQKMNIIVQVQQWLKQFDGKHNQMKIVLGKLNKIPWSTQNSLMITMPSYKTCDSGGKQLRLRSLVVVQLGKSVSFPDRL